MPQQLAQQPRLKDSGVLTLGISGGQWIGRERTDGALTAGDRHERYWEAAAAIHEAVHRPAPADLTEAETRGYDDATALTDVEPWVQWQHVANRLEQDWASASDQNAPWRWSELGNADEQVKLDQYWDARADRAFELLTAYRAAEPHWIDGEAQATPDGCRHCGYARSSHGHRFDKAVAGGHHYTAPDDELRKTRMRARRALNHS